MSRRVLAVLVFLWSAVLAAALFFLALQGRRLLFLRLELEARAASAPVGEVWWTLRHRPFNPSDSISFQAVSGYRTVSVPIPVEIDSLQIRPGGTPGTDVVVRSIELATPVATLRRWDRRHGFGGWHGTRGLTRFRAEDGALRMQIMAADGGFQMDDVQPLRDERRRWQHLRIALVGGLVAGLLQTAALLLCVRAGPTGAGAQPVAASRTPQGAWLLFAGTTAVCLLLAWLFGRGLLKGGSPAVFTDTGEYSLAFVDHLGRRLSETDGSLRLVLDPYSLYRNAPDQRTNRFRIDAHGYRGRFDEGDARPRVLFLGGSAAFGFGLDSDADVFTARLSAQEPRWQMVNAAAVGYLSGQELSELVHHGNAVAPVAVVAVDGWNDVYVPLLAASRFPAAGLALGFNWDVFHLVENRLRLFTLGGAAEVLPAQPTEPIPDLARRITATYTSNLEEMQRFCASRGIPLLVVLQPWVGTRHAPPDAERQVLQTWTRKVSSRTDPALYDGFLRGARSFLTAHGIPFVDLNASPPFADGTEPLFPDVVHPNARGHLFMASQIQPRLVSLLSPRSGPPSTPTTR